MTWTEGCLRISDTIAIHGGYLGIISFGICVRIGDIEDYAQSKYSEGFDDGYDECASRETCNEGW